MNIDYFLVSHRLPIALAAQDAGYEVHIAAKTTNYGDMIRSYGITTHSLDIDRTNISLISLFKTFISIKNVIKKLRPSIVHFVSIKPVILGGISTHLMREKPAIVSSISGLGYIFVSEGLKANFRRYLVSILYRIALYHKKIVVIFQNNNDLSKVKRMSGISSKDVQLIAGSGVDLNKFSITDFPKGVPIVLFPARLVISKGIHEFVNAAKLLKGSARFVISGQLDYESADSITLSLLEEWTKERLVEYWGFSNDMSETIGKSSIVALPSYREGLPKVLCEAAACGRPIVTTNVPGCRDAILSEETGILVPVKDSILLAKAIKKLIVETELAYEMGKKGRLLAESKFDIKQVTNIHLDIYNKMS
tara:strand:+ start:524 stop:1615 length:1092 start_codon:yes stop_codon:yes gene_type:complete